MDDDLQGFETLLREAQELGAQPRRTFLEIAGLSHRELVLQRYLEFFLDPANTEAHGLGSLLADSVVQCATGDLAATSSVNDVLTEVSTGEGHRLDIVLVETERVVKIELKIHADTYNDFRAYAAYRGADWPPESTEDLNIVLAPARLGMTDESGGYAGGFRLLTFGTLTARIRSNFGAYATEPNIGYVQYLLDLVATMEHLEEGKMTDAEFLELLAREELHAQDFVRKVMATTSELKSMAKTLRDQLEQRSDFSHFTWTIYGGSKYWIGAIVSAEARLHDAPVLLKLWVAPIGWGLSIESREGKWQQLRSVAREIAPNRFEEVTTGRNPHLRVLLSLPPTTENISAVVDAFSDMVDGFELLPAAID